MINETTNDQYLLAVAHDNQTNSTRSIIIPKEGFPKNRTNGKPMLIDMYSLSQDAKLIEHMIKRKIANDGDLIGEDQFHFVNWCVGYCNMPKEKQSKLQVEATVQTFDNLKQAEEMLEFVKNGCKVKEEA